MYEFKLIGEVGGKQMEKKPMYRKIEEHLKSAIDSKELKEGDLLPSESKLCEEFSVARMTVRVALNNLVAEGYIVKKKGLGSIVVSKKIYDNISIVTSFTTEMKEKGFDIYTILDGFEVVYADENISENLNVQIGEAVWEIKRIRVANDIRISYMITYMPVKLFSNLERKHCEGSLYEYIQNECGLKISLAERSVEAVSANKEFEDVLKLKKYEPLLHIEQVGKFENNDVFEYSHTYHHGYKLTLNAVGK